MPELDRDLFQLLLIALMGIAVLLLLALISTLSGIKKALKQQVQETRHLAEAGGLGARGDEPALLPSAAVEDRPPALQTPEPSHYGIDDSDDRPLLGGAATPGAAHVASPESAPETSPEPVSLGPDTGFPEPVPPATRAPWDQPDEDETPAGEPAATTPGGERPGGSADPFAAEFDEASTAGPATEEPGPTFEAFDEPSEPAGAGPETAAQSPSGDPFAAEAPGSQDVLAGTPGASSSDPFLTGEDENPFMRDADQPAPQSTLDEPEEQPFERNGRWFFKREGELLVYEEGTGEWVPADPADAEPPRTSPAWSGSPTAEPSGTSPAGSFDAGPTDTAELEAFDTGAEEEPRPVAGGGFWKCPSCGAVNGSSAATCRMCFSARP